MSQELLRSAPQSEAHRLVDFDRIDVVPGIVNNTFILIVHGTKPCVNMLVSLSPRIYITCPDYWDIEVVGYLPNGICLTQVTPFAESIPLAGITGSKGIRVVGARKEEARDVPGGCKAGQNFG